MIRYPALPIKWPNNAKIAVLLASEYEAVRETPNLETSAPDYRYESMARYEANCGLNRILEILDVHQVKSTIFVNGATVEKYPDSVRKIAALGHEVGAHGWMDAPDLSGLSKQNEEEVVARTRNVIERIANTRPVGWLSPKAHASANTFEIIADHNFTWNCDMADNDLPYIIELGDKHVVEIPLTPTNDDMRIIGEKAPMGTPQDLLNSWKEDFDQLYSESAKAPKLMTITWHQKITGRPARSRALDSFIAYVRKFSGVWFARGCEIADWWIAQGY